MSNLDLFVEEVEIHEVELSAVLDDSVGELVVEPLVLRWIHDDMLLVLDRSIADHRLAVADMKHSFVVFLPRGPRQPFSVVVVGPSLVGQYNGQIHVLVGIRKVRELGTVEVRLEPMTVVVVEVDHEPLHSLVSVLETVQRQELQQSVRMLCSAEWEVDSWFYHRTWSNLLDELQEPGRHLPIGTFRFVEVDSDSRGTAASDELFLAIGAVRTKNIIISRSL